MFIVSLNSVVSSTETPALSYSPARTGNLGGYGSSSDSLPSESVRAGTFVDTLENGSVFIRPDRRDQLLPNWVRTGYITFAVNTI